MKPLPLLITDDEYIPIYLQLVHQIRYLITSRELPANAQLPSVRTLADTLKINASTVAQAYRILKSEGLIASKRGKGTYVVALPDNAVRYSTRQALLTQYIEEVVTQGFALGFDATALRQHLATHLQQRVRTLPIMLIAPALDTAEKYASIIQKSLPQGVITTVTPCAINQLEAKEPWILDAYKHTYFTAVAFMPNVPKVEALLAQYSIKSEIIGLTANVNQETIERLRTLDPAIPHTLLTEARNVNSALSILGKYSSLDLHALQVLTELSGNNQLDGLKQSHVIHSFGMNTLLNKYKIPETQRLELAFTLSDDSQTRLRELVYQHAFTNDT